MKKNVLLTTGFFAVALACGGVAWTVQAEPNTVDDQVDQAEIQKAPGVGFLGIAVAEAPPIEADSRSPVLVVSVVQPDSPAERAGLQSGDTLLRIDDQKLVHPVQLTRLVQDMTPGSETKLHLERQGEAMELTATLGERPEGLAQPMMPRMAPAVPAEPGAMVPREFRMLPMEQNGDFGRADFDQMFRDMEQRMQELRRELDAAPQLKLDLEKMMPARGLHSRMEIADEDHVLTVTTTNGERHLKAVDKQGNVVFDGPITTEEQLKKVPDGVREKVPSSPAWPKAEPKKPAALKAA